MQRNDGVKEWITSSGPLLEPVHLMILSQQPDAGIKYGSFSQVFLFNYGHLI